MIFTELLRIEDSSAIAGYGRKLGWITRGRMAQEPYERLAASFERAWHQGLERAWRTQLQLGREHTDGRIRHIPSDFIAAYLETALSLADVVTLSVCCAGPWSEREWQSTLQLCKEMGIDLSFAVLVCHLKYRYRTAGGVPGTPERLDLARRMGLPYLYASEQALWVFASECASCAPYEQALAAYQEHACPQPARSLCACLFCYRCPDCLEQRLVEWRDLASSQVPGGRCAVCGSYATYQRWLREATPPHSRGGAKGSHAQ
jgi:hypothetical protein